MIAPKCCLKGCFMLSSLMKILLATASNSKLVWDAEAPRLKPDTAKSWREHCV